MKPRPKFKSNLFKTIMSICLQIIGIIIASLICLLIALYFLFRLTGVIII